MAKKTKTTKTAPKPAFDEIEHRRQVVAARNKRNLEAQKPAPKKAQEKSTEKTNDVSED